MNDYSMNSMFNFFNCPPIDQNPPIVRHFVKNPQLEIRQKALVLVKDFEAGKIMEP